MELEHTSNLFDTNCRLEDHFIANVLKNPNKVAISCNGTELTYKELDYKSELVAQVVRKNLNEDTDYVGLLMNRGVEMIISLLGILKAGVAYIPIDPVNNPNERIKLCVSGVNLKLLLSDKVVDLEDVQTLLIDDDFFQTKLNLSSEDNQPVKKSEIAYAIFTSGTTGIPKAVPIKHENVLNMFNNGQDLFEFSKNDVWALFHSIAFDFSVWEVWGTLLYGAKLEIVPFAIAKNTPRFRRFLSDKKVSVLNQTNSAFYSLIKADQSKDSKIDSLRCLIFGGEKLDIKLLEPWINRYDSTAKLITVYGTTETTIFTTTKNIGPQDLLDVVSSPIGRPMPGSDIVLIDDNDQVADRGEIYISGERLSKGYINRAQLNKTKFITKNISGIPTDFYKTGDLAYRKNGEYFFIGRVDSQVKFNGYRIELEGVESVLMSHPKIMRSVVIVDNSLNHPRLVSFLEAKEDLTEEEKLTVVEEAKGLAESLLPFYMVPSELIMIDEIPLTVNGKLNHKELSEFSKTY